MQMSQSNAHIKNEPRGRTTGILCVFMYIYIYNFQPSNSGKRLPRIAKFGKLSTQLRTTNGSDGSSKMNAGWRRFADVLFLKGHILRFHITIILLIFRGVVLPAIGFAQEF